MSVPTVITHVLDGAPQGAWDVWGREELIRRFGDTTFASGGPVFNHPFLWRAIANRTSVTLTEALDMNASIAGPFFVPGIYPLARSLLQASESHDVPLFRLLDGQGELGYVSLTAKGQFAPIHIHHQAFVTQVKGTKGWVLAPPEAFPDHIEHGRVFVDYSDPGEHGEGAPEDSRLNNAEQLCGLFDNSCLAPGGLGSVPSVYCCQLNAGEALVWPGKDFWEGWWHGTCGLEDWNAAFSFFHWNSPEACRLYFENGTDEPVEVLWLDPEGEPVVFEVVEPGHWAPQDSWLGDSWSLRGLDSGATSRAVACGGEKPGFWHLSETFSLALRPGGPSF